MGLTENSFLERWEEMGIKPTPTNTDITRWAYDGIDIALRSNKTVDDLCDFLQKAWALKTLFATNPPPQTYCCIDKRDQL